MTELKKKFNRHIAKILDYYDDPDIQAAECKSLIKRELWYLYEDISLATQVKGTQDGTARLD